MPQNSYQEHRSQALWKDLLELSKTGMYAKYPYPYRELHRYWARALVMWLACNKSLVTHRSPFMLCCKCSHMEQYCQISSRSGECHRLWYTGGKHIPAKWRDSLKASHWSKWWQSIITRSHNHPTSDGSDILVRFGNTFYREFPRRISHHLINWSRVVR